MHGLQEQFGSLPSAYRNEMCLLHTRKDVLHAAVKVIRYQWRLFVADLVVPLLVEDWKRKYGLGDLHNTCDCQRLVHASLYASSCCQSALPREVWVHLKLLYIKRLTVSCYFLFLFPFLPIGRPFLFDSTPSANCPGKVIQPADSYQRCPSLQPEIYMAGLDGRVAVRRGLMPRGWPSGLYICTQHLQTFSI